MSPKIFSTQARQKQESFTHLMRKDPDVLKKLLSYLKKRNVLRASEMLITMLSVCQVNCEPDWIHQSTSEEELFALCDEVMVNHASFPFPPPSTLENFWYGYQQVVKNYEAYVIRDLIHKLRSIHGSLLRKIDWTLTHEAELKETKKWGVEPFNCFKHQFEVDLLKHTKLLRSLTYHIPFLQHKREVESSLFSTTPIQYRVEFDTIGREEWVYRHDKTIVFCLTSYMKLPKLLQVPSFYHSAIDPGGVVRFIPHECNHCENDPRSVFTGLKHLSIHLLQSSL